MREELKEFQQSMRQVLNAAELAADEPRAWEQLAELGWLLVPVPEDQDGLGMGAPGTFLLLLELGRRLGAVPYLPALLSIDAVCRSQLSDRADWIERLTGGELVSVAAAVSTYEIGLDADGKLRLNGLAEAVQSADNASHILVWNAAAECVALVPLDKKGVEIIARSTWDTTRRLFAVGFDNVVIDEQLILASGAEATDLINRLVSMRELAIAADCLGGAAALLEMTVEHLNTRVQYGRPLALFQALKHRCADMKTQAMAAEALILEVLERHGDVLDSENAANKVMESKYLASDVFVRVVEESLQLHGGIGMAEEHPCHLFLKRAMLNQHLGRPAETCELAIADACITDSVTVNS